MRLISTYNHATISQPDREAAGPGFLLEIRSLVWHSLARCISCSRRAALLSNFGSRMISDQELRTHASPLAPVHHVKQGHFGATYMESNEKFPKNALQTRRIRRPNKTPKRSIRYGESPAPLNKWPPLFCDAENALKTP